MSRSVERIPECGAIDDNRSFSAESYAQAMRRNLWAEYERFAAFALGASDLRAGARVLEVGPGPGWIGVIMAKARPDISIEAVDASDDMVRAYRATIDREGLGGSIRVRSGRVERLGDTVSGPFDLVYSRDSLHHWEDPAVGLAAIRRLLTPGGTVALQDERRDIGPAARLVVRAQCAFVLGPMGEYWRSSIAAGYTAAELEAFLSGAGFGDIRVKAEFLNLSAVATA